MAAKPKPKIPPPPPWMASENDIKEELSYAYLHAMATRAGFSVTRPSKDRDSVDAVVEAKDFIEPTSPIRSPRIEIQLKGHALSSPKESHFSYEVPIKNYKDLRHRCMIPRLLVVLLLPIKQGEWVSHSPAGLTSRRCAYWFSLAGQPEVTNKKSVTVSIPVANLLTAESLTELMRRVSYGEIP